MMSLRGGLHTFMFFLASALPFSAAFAQRTTASSGGGFLDSIMSAVVAAFTANPLYPIVIAVVGFGIGWFVHKMAFGW